MTYEEILAQARTCIGPYCKACPVCNGQACRNTIPGPGAKGSGTVAIRNYDAWQRIRVNLDTITENLPADTSFSLLGQSFRYPFFAGPVGATQMHYGQKFDDEGYNDILVSACAQSGHRRLHRAMGKCPPCSPKRCRPSGVPAASACPPSSPGTGSRSLPASIWPRRPALK